MLPAPGGNRLLALGVLLGNASYAVYLLHGPVEIYMSSILACYAAHCGNLEWFLILAAASLLLVTLASIVLFNKFEEPSRKAIKGFFLFSTVSDRP
jgi:peptidoglycan/LPS O-acetylase OafA/YrhL